MDFMRILKSFEDFLFEAISWLFFYPRTLWRSVRHPMSVMDYAEAELHDKVDDRYADTISPPLFLLLTLLLAAVLADAVAPPADLARSQAGLPSYLRDQEHLLVFRSLLFSVYPLMLALRMLKHRKAGVTRKTLRPPFYSQCYPAAPFAFANSLGLALVGTPWAGSTPIGIALIGLAFIWYVWVEILWFARRLEIGRAKAAGIAGSAIFEGLVVTSLMLAGVVLWRIYG
jgi:hypothetical protein